MIWDRLEFMDVQQKDNQLYLTLIAMTVLALGVAWQSYHYVSLIIMGLVGLLIAVHLHKEKNANKDKVVCPIGEHCHRVITSKYSVFMGISVEVYGMLYYGLIISGYIAAILFTVPTWFMFFLLANTAIALLFSAYLTWIQAVPLGQWCIWCVTSAIACVAIFSFAVLGLAMPVSELVAMYDTIPHAVYMFGIAVGLGTAISADAIFINSLKDFKISDSQARAVKILYEITWAALAFIVLAGAGFFYANPALLTDPIYQTSILAISVLVDNAFLLYLYTSDKLVEVHFNTEDTEEVDSEMRHVRMAAFMLMGVSTASWVMLFLLTFTEIPAVLVSTQILVGIYMTLLIIGVALGAISEFILKKESEGEFKSKIPILFD